jgi:hypothetical protein
MDGLDGNRAQPFKWAVGTALVSVYQGGDVELFDYTAEEFVKDAYDFIVEAFEDEGLQPPTSGLPL